MLSSYREKESKKAELKNGGYVTEKDWLRALIDQFQFANTILKHQIEFQILVSPMPYMYRNKPTHVQSLR